MGRLLAITGGHRFDEAAFVALLDDVAERLGWSWTHESHPDARRWLHPDHAGTFDTIVLYDIPGLSLARGTEPVVVEPSPDECAALLGLVRAGQGVVALHHALAGWPSWDDYATLLGGRFAYRPGPLRGGTIPASGYRMDSYRVDVVDPTHPVCAGVESFVVTDELYCCPVFETEVEPLLSTPVDTTAGSMIDTHHEVVSGAPRTAVDQPSSSLLGWTRTDGAGRVVYLLPGHGPTTMAHSTYRRLVANACAFVAGPG